MSYATQGRTRYTAADKRRKEAERLAYLVARDQRWAAGTVDEMLAEYRLIAVGTEAELRAEVEARHATLVALYRA
jgi:hypothetical protein